MGIKLIEITKDNLEKSVKVAKLVFPDEWHKDKKTNKIVYYPEVAYKMAIDEKSKDFKYYLAIIKIEPKKKFVLDLADYINKKEQVIGITGHYTDNGNKDVIWLGWYGILERYRNRGYGKELLEKCIQKFKRMGYKELRLYTTHHKKHEARARKMYKKRGFKRYRWGKLDGIPSIWLKLDLKK